MGSLPRKVQGGAFGPSRLEQVPWCNRVPTMLYIILLKIKASSCVNLLSNPMDHLDFIDMFAIHVYLCTYSGANDERCTTSVGSRWITQLGPANHQRRMRKRIYNDLIRTNIWDSTLDTRYCTACWTSISNLLSPVVIWTCVYCMQLGEYYVCRYVLQLYVYEYVMMTDVTMAKHVDTS